MSTGELELFGRDFSMLLVQHHFGQKTQRFQRSAQLSEHRRLQRHRCILLWVRFIVVYVLGLALLKLLLLLLKISKSELCKLW